MAPIAKKTKKAMNFLQEAYRNGMVDYPRVDNNFFEKARYDLFPHPPLRRLVPMMEPLAQSDIVFNKNSSILLLSLRRLVQPSAIVDTAEFIDSFFDDNLNFSSKEKQEKAEMMIQVYDEYLKENNLEKRLMKSLSSLYADASDADGSDASLFETKDFYFTKEMAFSSAMAPSFLKSATQWDASLKKKKKSSSDTAFVYKVEDRPEISDGVEAFKSSYFVKARIRKLQKINEARAGEVIGVMQAVNDLVSGSA
jgi:hypothetical protein